MPGLTTAVSHISDIETTETTQTQERSTVERPLNRPLPEAPITPPPDIEEPSPDDLPDSQHHPDCALVARKGVGAVAGILDSFARRGWMLDKEAVDWSLEICPVCRRLFQEYSRAAHEEDRETAVQLAGQIGPLRQYRTALRANRVWLTENIEQEFAHALPLRQYRKKAEVWQGLVQAASGLLREACDPRAAEIPYVRIGPGLIPQGWRTEDAIGYVNAEVEIGAPIVAAGLAELEKKIRSHSDKAFEPLGWFVPQDNDLYLIGWDDLLTPVHTVQTTPSPQAGRRRTRLSFDPNADI